MIANDTRPGPANGVMFICPVNDCPWRFERTEPNLALVRRSSVRPMALDFGPAFADANRRDEDACRAHLAEHPIEDFVRTLAELRDQLAAAAVV